MLADKLIQTVPINSPMLLVTVSILIPLFALSACGPPPVESDEAAELSQFAADTLVSGRILENSTACEVDAVCFLRIEFEDTVIIALYGTGERPPPPCQTPPEASNMAFQVERGDLVEVVVSVCGADRPHIQQLVRERASRR